MSLERIKYGKLFRLRMCAAIALTCLIAMVAFFLIRPTVLDITARRTPPIEALEPRARLIVEGALAEVENETRYEDKYKVLEYPAGDVPANTGVCTDLIIRALRNAGIDLQKELHEDRFAHPEVYPVHEWAEKEADPNIDHRRCRNLVVWFDRFAETLPTEWNAETRGSWRPGDIVFYADRGSDGPIHVAVVSNKRTWRGMPFRIELTPPKSIEARPIIYAPLLSGERIHSHFRLRGEF